jgi:hypothetical protein
VGPREDADYLHMLGILFYVGFLAVLAAVAAIPARTRGHGARVVVFVFGLTWSGLLILSFGLVALVYNGYAEDNTLTPMRTLDVAIPALVVAVLCFATAWYVSSRPPKHA